MKCEEFSSEKYAQSLMIIVKMPKHSVGFYALEAYYHLETCEEDRRRYQEYIARSKLDAEDLGLIREGLDILEDLAQNF